MSEEEVLTIRVRSAKLPISLLDVPTLPSSPLAEVLEFVNEASSLSSSSHTLIEPAFAKLFLKGKLLDMHRSVKDNGVRDQDTLLLGKSNI
jgi:hypothetical protein